jgi:endonuclease YncB( thermonuclease family)
MKFSAIMLMLMFTAVLPAPLASAETVAGNASVIDGDTIEIHDVRIRIEGMDTPESSQWCTRYQKQYRCGREAAFALADLVGHHTVTCTQTTTDRYGRMVATCQVDSVDIGRWMVAQGHAIADRKYSLDYVDDEDRARVAKVGMWAGEFEEPSKYRHQPRRPRPVSGEPVVRRVCSCPDDMDRAGRRCGRRSAYLRSGGKSLACGGR